MIDQISLILGKIVLVMMIVLLAISTVFTLSDYLKKRRAERKPFFSFIIPTHNDGKHIADTIKTLYASYDNKKMEVFIVNDCSTDNTLDILKNLNKKYNFKIVNNKKNMGKANSVNSVAKRTRGEIIMIIDSDVIVNKAGLQDIVARFESDAKVGGISCRYRVLNEKSFWAKMQTIEYNMLAFTQAAYNPFSTIGFWGGCMAFRRKAFFDIGGLSDYCLTEDNDAALKLPEKGWTAKQSYIEFPTVVPDNFKDLYKQKLRWGGGFMQGLVSHYKFYLKDPLAIFFILAYSFFAFNFIFVLINDFLFFKQIYLTNSGQRYSGEMIIDIIQSVAPFLYMQVRNFGFYLLFTVPYVFFDKEDRKNISKYFLLIPYALIYFPVYAVINVIGFMKAIYHYKDFKNKKRAW
jgi:cellulose synthase/poly-beta-1,6-N-acetylglucosamine synthase-like glycosyltransferase